MHCTLLFSAKTRNVGQLEGDNLLSHSVVIFILSAFCFSWQNVSVHGTGTLFLNNESTQKICVCKLVSLQVLPPFARKKAQFFERFDENNSRTNFGDR